jgi:hypothetical protein
MISYEKLVSIETSLASTSAKLDAALALKGDVDKLANRVSKLETSKAYSDGSSNSRNTILAWIGGMVTAAIGGGALMYLPKIGTVLLHIPTIVN